MTFEFEPASFPWLTISILLPLVAAAILFFLDKKWAKPISIIVSAIVFVISTWMLFAYDYSSY